MHAVVISHRDRKCNLLLKVKRTKKEKKMHEVVISHRDSKHYLLAKVKRTKKELKNHEVVISQPKGNTFTTESKEDKKETKKCMRG